MGTTHTTDTPPSATLDALRFIGGLALVGAGFILGQVFGPLAERLHNLPERLHSSAINAFDSTVEKIMAPMNRLDAEQFQADQARDRAAARNTAADVRPLRSFRPMAAAPMDNRYPQLLAETPVNRIYLNRVT